MKDVLFQEARQHDARDSIGKKGKVMNMASGIKRGLKGLFCMALAVAVNWYKRRRQFQYARYYGGSYTPKAGDLVFYYSRGSFCHVGMITAAPVNGYLQTVEGNIQCADGNWRVVRFTKNSKRRVNSSYVYGYGTPNY